MSIKVGAENLEYATMQTFRFEAYHGGSTKIVVFVRADREVEARAKLAKDLLSKNFREETCPYGLNVERYCVHDDIKHDYVSGEEAQILLLQTLLAAKAVLVPQDTIVCCMYQD